MVTITLPEWVFWFAIVVGWLYIFQFGLWAFNGYLRRKLEKRKATQ